MDTENRLLKPTFIILLVILAAVLVWSLRTSRINLSDYQVYIDYGSMTDEQIAVMDTILLCTTTGTNTVEQNLSQTQFDEVIDHIGLYFGSTLLHQNVALWRPGYAEVNLDLLETLEQNKTVLDDHIDRILSQMYEGSDRFKLLQISRYIASTVKYSYSIDDIEPLSGLTGRGSCMTYSMLFYKLATRIGMETCICYGTVGNGDSSAPHAWNMVTIDGQQYFYDLTWYDNLIPDSKYIHSKTSWGRSFDNSQHGYPK